MTMRMGGVSRKSSLSLHASLAKVINGLPEARCHIFPEKSEVGVIMERKPLDRHFVYAQDLFLIAEKLSNCSLSEIGSKTLLVDTL